jgi:O-antigen/teichoic acid export membrane protein
MSKKKKKTAAENLLNALFSVMTFFGFMGILIGVLVVFDQEEWELFAMLPACATPLILSSVGLWLVNNREKYRLSAAQFIASLALTSLGVVLILFGITAFFLPNDTGTPLETLFLTAVCLTPGLLTFFGGLAIFRYAGGGPEPPAPDDLRDTLGKTDYDEYFED